MADNSTDKTDRSDHRPDGQSASLKRARPKSRIKRKSVPKPRSEPKPLRQPKLKTPLELWAFLFANTGNVFRAVVLFVGVGLALAVPFGILALIFTLLHLQFAVAAAMYSAATAIVAALGFALRARLKRSNADRSGDGDPPEDDPDDASDDSE